MDKQMILTLVTGALAVGLMVLLGLGRIQWVEFVAGLGLLLTPTPTHAIFKDGGTQ